MKKSLIFILMFFFCKPLFSQSYQAYIDTGYQSYLDKDFNQSLKCYKKAFNVKQGAATDYYNAACVASLTKQLKLSVYFLKEAFKDGYDDINFLNKDTDLIFLRQQATWNSIYDSLKIIMNSVVLNYDKPLKDSLAIILSDDQRYRNRYAALFKSNVSDSTEMNNLRVKILHIDSVNQDKVVQILDKYGWPSRKKVGPSGSTALFAVLQHASLDIQKKYLNLLKEAVLKNEAKPVYLALMTDRIAIREGKEQIYGSQVDKDPSTQKFFVYPVFDPKNVDDRRKEVGLGKLADYLKDYGIIWK